MATQKPVAVVHDRMTKVHVVARFNTIAEAEACIEGLRYLDKAQVDAGMFGIDAPEAMLNHGPSNKRMTRY